MDSKPVALSWISVCLLALVAFTGTASAAGGETPPVRAVLFYGPNCAQCGELFGYYLPGLFDEYDGRLEVAGIDVGQGDGAAVYRAAAARYGLPAEWSGVPAIVAGDRSMTGLVAIAEILGDGFEGVARDPHASSWPPIAGLAPLIPAGVAELKARVAREGVPVAREPQVRSSVRAEVPDRDRIANRLAIAVLVGMVLALVHSLVRVRRARSRSAETAGWVLPLVILVGLGVSGYTAYTSLADVTPMCGPIGSCDVVQHSEYAKIFGIPMGVLGLLGYGAILVTWVLGLRLSPDGGGWRWLPWAIALFGVLFSLRLTALEPFVIGHTCLWCLGSAVSITITLWLLSHQTR